MARELTADDEFTPLSASRRAPPRSDFGEEMPGDLHLDAARAPRVPNGAPRPLAPGEFLKNPNGSWSSEVSLTVENPDLNGGKPTVIPGMWIVGGKPRKLNEDQAVEAAKQSGLKFRAFDSLDAAEKFSVDRESEWQGIRPENAGKIAPLYSRSGVRELSPDDEFTPLQKPDSFLSVLGEETVNTAKGVGRGLARASVKLTDLAATLGALVDSPDVSPSTREAADTLQNDIRKGALKKLETPPAERTVAGEVGGDIAEIVPPLVVGGPIGPILLAASSTLDFGKQLIDQGVDADTAGKVAAVAGAANFAGAKLPFIGKSAASRVASGAAGNVALGTAQRKQIAGILDDAGYHDLAKQYAVTPESVATDAGTGAVFGAVAHAIAAPGERAAETANTLNAVDSAMQAGTGEPLPSQPALPAPGAPEAQAGPPALPPPEPPAGPRALPPPVRQVTPGGDVGFPQDLDAARNPTLQVTPRGAAGTPAQLDEAVTGSGLTPDVEAAQQRHPAYAPVELTPEDHASPIPDDLILQGKTLVQEAMNGKPEAPAELRAAAPTPVEPTPPAAVDTTTPPSNEGGAAATGKAAPVVRELRADEPFEPLSTRDVTPKRSQFVADARYDSALEYLSKRGGISTDEAIAQGLDPADIRGARGHGIRRPFTKAGMSFDAAAEALHEAGYPVTDADGRYSANKVLDLIDDEIRGKKVYSSRNANVGAEELRQAAERYASEPEGADLPDQFYEDLPPPRAERVGLVPVSEREAVLAHETWDRHLTELSVRAVASGVPQEHVESALGSNASQGAIADQLKALTVEAQSRDRQTEARPHQPEPQQGGDREPAPAALEGPAATAPQPVEQRPPEPRAPGADLLGQDTRQAQALADEKRAKDEARSPNRDVSIETGNPSDLFSESRKNVDIGDVASTRVSGATVRGEKLGNGYTAFAQTSGTLGIPRTEMPQIKAEHRGALANFLKARGIEGTEETVPASSLKPTQAEFSEQKVLKAKNFQGGDRAILVSSDGYVLDGHHQFMAALDKHEDVRTIKLDAPIRDLLKVVPEFPSAEGGAPEETRNASVRDERDRGAEARPPELAGEPERGATPPTVAQRPETQSAPAVSQEGGADRVPPANEAAHAERPLVEKIPGTRGIAQRIVNAEEKFIANAMENAGLTREQAERALATMRKGGKKAPLKIDPITGQYTYSHGAFGEPDVLRRAAGTEEPASEPAKPPERSVAAARKPTTGISDFGAKIEGARKDYAAQLKDAASVDVAASPLSESWPEPDYNKLLESGVSKWSVAFVHAARDEIPTKPQRAWKLAGWTKQVETLRDFAVRLLNGEISTEKLSDALHANQVLGPVLDRATLYLKVGHDKSLKGVRISNGMYSVHNGVHFSEPKSIWTVERRAPKTAMGNWPTELGTGSTKQEAIDDFTKKWAKTSPAAEETKAITFSIYGTRDGGKYGIGRKVGRTVVILKGGFEKVKQAREWMAEHHDELVKKLDQVKLTPNERRPENSPRVGADHRNGTDVTPEQFTETFGFRGVQFGNYVEGSRRQEDLNESYDALTDLAGMLDVPPKALSLNGELGLAFGARGTGGTHAASAHYEPDRVVINLTKKKGAGSLAHEWFHALDNYFSRKGGGAAGFLTNRNAPAGEGVRPEMDQAFADVRKAIAASEMRKRSRQLDRTRAKDYWSTGEELAARAFEAYTIAKLQDQGASNDYLANIVSQKAWDAATSLGLEKENTYPYPTTEEMGPIREAFDKFFETVETQPTDTGVAMFSEAPSGWGEIETAEPVNVASLRTAVDTLFAGAKNAPTVEFVRSDGLPPAAAADSNKSPGMVWAGVFIRDTNQVFINTDIVRTPDEAAWIAAHEIAGHLGIQGFVSKGATGTAAYADVARARALAARNPYIDGLAEAIRAQRTALTRGQAVEEALAETQAALRTGNFDRIESRYGDFLRVPGGIRGEPKPELTGLRKVIDDFVTAIKNIVKKFMGYDFSNEKVREMLEGAWRYVREGATAADGAETLNGERVAFHEESRRGRAEERESAARPPVRKPTPGEDRGYARIAQKALDVWNDNVGWRYGPLGKLPNQREYLAKRYRALGKVEESQDVARAVSKALTTNSASDRTAVYDYLTNRNGDPQRIENAALRRNAIRAKALIDNVGKRLVNAGLLSEEAYQEHAGEYLPRLYLKHVLNEAGTMSTAGTGLRTSDQGYLKARKDIDEETRKVLLGEIHDPAFLASFGLSKTMRDLAVTDFLKAVGENKDWVPEGATVEWRGKNVSPFWLEREGQALRRRSRAYDGPAREKAAKIADEMDEVSSKAMEQLGNLDKAGYEQIPDSPRYGVLRGMWVRKEIYGDLVGANHFVKPGASVAESILGDGGVLSKAVGWWKFKSVLLNPPTQIRNFLSNMPLLHISGVPFRRVYSGEIIGKAIHSIASQDKYWKIAKRYGIFSGTFANVEGARIRDEWIAAQKLDGSGLAKVKAFLGSVTNKVGDVYAMTEAIFKIAKIRDAMEREGKSETDAVLDAQEALFDYSLVPRSVRYARNQPLGAPFMTFFYKMLGQMSKQFLKHPLRFAPYAAIPFLLNELIKHSYDVNSDDIKHLRTALPSWMRQRGHMLLLPYKDEYGRWQVVDMGYLTPWGQLADTYAATMENIADERRHGTGDDDISADLNASLAALKGAASGFLLGGPVPDVISALKTNVDPFTGKPIVDERDPPEDQLQALMQYVWNLAAPPMFNDKGAVNQFRNAVQGKVNKRGELGQTATQAALRAFGINVYPVDPVASREANLRSMKHDIQDSQARAKELVGNPNLTDAQREKLEEVWRTILQRRLDAAYKYAADSEVNPKLQATPQEADVDLGAVLRSGRLPMTREERGASKDAK